MKSDNKPQILIGLLSISFIINVFGYRDTDTITQIGFFSNHSKNTNVDGTTEVLYWMI